MHDPPAVQEQALTGAQEKRAEFGNEFLDSIIFAREAMPPKSRSGRVGISRDTLYQYVPVKERRAGKSGK